MSFRTIRRNARNRFSETQTLLNYLTSLEPRNISDLIPLEVKIMKGLFQVHLYAALEKTINELIENTILYIGSNNIQQNHFALPFSTISMISKLKAFKDCGYKGFFEKAIEIFSEMENSDTASLNETMFANQLQNVWTATINEIVLAFGMKEIIIEPRIKTTINELVEKRNAVAHGRESASVVGERFRTDVLRLKMTEVTTFTYNLIDIFEEFYSTKSYLKPHAKRRYATATY